jgi:hypothetical protein
MALVIFAIGASSAAFGATHTDAGTALIISNRTTELIEGSFGNKGSLISFSGWLEGGQRARVSLKVNDVVLEATYDAGTGTLYLGGHDAALTVEDKEALVAFSHVLEQSLGTASGLHERLLYARVLHWAEAPVGLPLTARTLRVPPVRQGEKGSTTKDLLESCQRSDQDGFLLFPSCSTGNRLLSHDATTHCFLAEAVRSGPGSDDCLGRCGPGCGCGWNRYTYDCGDHDRCCRVHGSCLNPRDASCGDEWWEAADDFVPVTTRLCWACRL